MTSDFSPISTELLKAWSQGAGSEVLRSSWDRPSRLSDAAFPDYAFVPGRLPHPRRDERGHSFEEAEPEVSDFDLNRNPLESVVTWRFGIDLFNGGYFWEAHEQLEALWHAAGRTGPLGDLLTGLIKAAAAHLKAFDGRRIGPWTLAVRAEIELTRAHEAKDREDWPLDLGSFIVAHRQWFRALREGDCLPRRFPYIDPKGVEGAA